MLVLHPATLLDSFISFSSFLIESLGFSMCSVISFANKSNFTSSFPVYMPFISCFCLIAMARTSSTMLNERGKSRHPCFVSDLKRNICSFCPLRMMLAVGLSHMAFIIWRYVPSVPTLLTVIFNHKWMLGFFKCFFFIYSKIMWFLSSILSMCYITFIDMHILYQTCIPGKNSCVRVV